MAAAGDAEAAEPGDVVQSARTFFFYVASGCAFQLPPQLLAIPFSDGFLVLAAPAKIWLGFTVLLSAHHFVLYSREVIDHLEAEAELVERSERRTVANATGEFDRVATA